MIYDTLVRNIREERVYLLGLDIGQTKIKAAVFTFKGEECTTASANASCIQNGDFSEKDMEELWVTVSGLIKEVTVEIDPRQIRAVGTSGHGNGIYPLDKEGRPFIKAVLSTDLRAGSIVEEWNRDGKAGSAFRYTIQSIWAGQPLPILEWFKRNNPAVYQEIGTILFCKDFINCMLCGNLTTDYSDISAAGVFDNVSGHYEGKLFGIFGLENRFPAVIKSTAVAGKIQEKAAAKTGLCEGTIVAGGGFDAAASAIGAGAWEDYSVTAGTWSINAAYTDQCVINGDILQCILSGDGERWFAVESSPTSAVNLEWFVNSIKPLNYKQCDEIAAAYNHKDVEGIYLPYINPMPRYPHIKGGFFGSFKDDNEKLRALYEGIAFGHRFHLENLKKAGIIRNKVRLSGGLSASSIWCQILADVLELPVETARIRNEGCFGAALCAGVAASVYPSLKEAVRMVHVGAVYRPQDSYEHKYRLFKEKIEESYAGNT
jgi:L-xylulokinase